MTTDYKVLADTPRLGKAGATVHLHPRQAKYWLQAGVIELTGGERAVKPAIKSTKSAGRKVGAERGRNAAPGSSDAGEKALAEKTGEEKA